jgi:DNA adenine methylase
MKTPYPWFGGKGRIAETIWQAFGDCPNYVEPFFGGGAVVLNRPGFDHTRHTETVNDLDCNVANFWRCLQKDPEQLASWADWPVNEVDLHARHQWLVNRTWGADSEFRESMMTDPDHCDFKQAGWWVWGICQWIGSGWCNAKQATVPTIDGNNGMGVHRQRPHLGDNGMGVHRQLPHLGNNGRGGASANLYAYFEALAERTRCLRICCGDFERVLGPTPTERLGITGVLLDPPYDLSLRDELYACESDAATRARQWALDNGHNPKLRIVLCGYEGEHDMPEGWRVVAWKAAGGFGSQGQGRGRNNANLERLWLSPACLPVEDETPCSLSLDEMAQWRRERQSQLSLWGAQ